MLIEIIYTQVKIKELLFFKGVTYVEKGDNFEINGKHVYILAFIEDMILFRWWTGDKWMYELEDSDWFDENERAIIFPE